MLRIALSRASYRDREHPAPSRGRREPKPRCQRPKLSFERVLVEHKHNGPLASKPDSNSKSTSWQLATPRLLLFARLWSVQKIAALDPKRRQRKPEKALPRNANFRSQLFAKRSTMAGKRQTFNQCPATKDAIMKTGANLLQELALLLLKWPNLSF